MRFNQRISNSSSDHDSGLAGAQRRRMHAALDDGRPFCREDSLALRLVVDQLWEISAPLRRRQRDALIQAMALAYPSKRAASIAIAKRLRDYAANGYPRDRRSHLPPPDGCEGLFRILELGDGKLIASRRIRQLLCGHKKDVEISRDSGLG
jgi:hypothetical protein